MTSEEIMALVDKYGRSCDLALSLSYEEQNRAALESAISTLVADLERHKRAVAENWMRVHNDGFYYCVFCGSIDDCPSVKHAADCVTGL